MEDKQSTDGPGWALTGDTQVLDPVVAQQQRSMVALGDRMKANRKVKGKGKLSESPFKVGSNSTATALPKPSIPPASTGPKDYFSPAPIPIPRSVRNAVAGSSRSTAQPGDVVNSRKPLGGGKEQDVEDDYEVVAGPDRVSTRSASPKKGKATAPGSSSYPYNYRQPEPGPSNPFPILRASTRAGAAHQANHDFRRVSDEGQVAPPKRGRASVSGSKSPTKAPPPTRPAKISAPEEEPEPIENPDGIYRTDPDGFEIVPAPKLSEPVQTGFARGTKRQSTGSASPNKPDIPLGQPGPSKQKQLLTRDNGQPMGTSRTRGDYQHNNGPIRSSGLASTTVQSAKVDVAHFVIDGPLKGMHSSTVSLRSDRHVILVGAVGEDVHTAAIPLHCVRRADLCDTPDHPFISLEVNLQNNLFHTLRKALLRQIRPGFHDTPLKEADMRVGTLHLYLHQSEESGAFVQAFEEYLPQRAGREVHRYLGAEKCQEYYAFKLVGRATTNAPPIITAPIDLSDSTESRPVKKAEKLIEAVVKEHDDAAAKRANRKGKARAVDQSQLPFQPPKRPAATVSAVAASPPPPASEPEPVRKSQRLSNTIHPTTDICSDNEVEEIPVTVKTPTIPAPVDRDTVLFPYPLTGRSFLNITKGELWRVMSGEFLNDVLIEWGLRHTLSLMEDSARSKVHLFNSFFYNKISSKERKMKYNPVTGSWPAYETVRKWTKTVDVFTKDYIIVPINEDYHWYLAVIVNPGAMLAGPKPSPQSSSPEAQAENEKSTDSGAGSIQDEIVVEDQLNLPEAEGDGATATNSGTRYIEVDDDLMEGDVSGRHAESDTGYNPAADESIDELDCLPPQPGPYYRPPTSSMKDLQIDTGVTTSDKDLGGRVRPTPGPGRPIKTSTLAAFKEQQEPEPPRPRVVRPEVSKLETKKVEDHKIWDSDTTWILTFDSLGSHHHRVGSILSDWLKWEAKARKADIPELGKTEYTHAQVPLQPNFSDCGLYLVHYARRLLENPETILKFVERRLPHKNSDERKTFDQQIDTIWGVGNLRGEWQAVLDSLQHEWDELKRNRDPAIQGEAQEEGQVEGAQDDGDDIIECVVDTAKPGTETEPTVPAVQRENEESPNPPEGDHAATEDACERRIPLEDNTNASVADDVADGQIGPSNVAELAGVGDTSTDNTAGHISDEPFSSIRPADQNEGEGDGSTMTSSSQPLFPSEANTPIESADIETGDVSMDTETTSSVVSPDSDASEQPGEEGSEDVVHPGGPPPADDGIMETQMQVEMDQADDPSTLTFSRTDPDFVNGLQVDLPPSERLLRNAGLRHALNTEPDATSTPRQKEIVGDRSVISVCSSDDEGDIGDMVDPGLDDHEPRRDQRGISAMDLAALSTPLTNSRPTPTLFAIAPHDSRLRKEISDTASKSAPASSPLSAAPSRLDAASPTSDVLSNVGPKPAPPDRIPSVPPWQNPSPGQTKSESIVINNSPDDHAPRPRDTRQRDHNRSKMMQPTGDPGISIDCLESVKESSGDEGSDKENIAGPSHKLALSPIVLPPSASRHSRQKREAEAPYDGLLDDDDDESLPTPDVKRGTQSATTKKYGKKSKPHQLRQTKLSETGHLPPRCVSESHRRDSHPGTPATQSRSVASKRKSKVEPHAAESSKKSRSDRPSTTGSRSSPRKSDGHSKAEAINIPSDED